MAICWLKRLDEVVKVGVVDLRRHNGPATCHVLNNNLQNTHAPSIITSTRGKDTERIKTKTKASDGVK